MDWNRKRNLLDKYWKGESNIEEEKELRDEVLEEPDKVLDDQEYDYFLMLDQFSKLDTNAGFEEKLHARIKSSTPSRFRYFHPYIWGAAAAILLLLTISIGLYQQPVPNEDEYIEFKDTREAFEFTKQTLVLFSCKLNEGASFTSELAQFNQTVEKIQLKEKINRK